MRQLVWPFSEALGIDVCELQELNDEEGILLQKFFSTMGNPPFKILGNHSNNMANEGVIYSAIFSFEVSLLKLRVSVIDFEFSSLLLIRCHK